MQNKLGSSPITIILVIVAFILVGGLAYMLGQRNMQPTENAQESPPKEACGTNAGPSIAITSPNGGESYSAGEEITVTWETCNMDPGMLVGMSLSASPYPNDIGFFIGEWVAAGNGSQTVTIPETAPSGSYVINISNPPETLGGADDWSDNSFQIN